MPVSPAAMSPEHVVGAQQTECARWSALLRRTRQDDGGGSAAPVASQGPASPAGGGEERGSSVQVVGWEYLMAKVTTACSGDVAMVTGHPGGEHSSRWGGHERGWGAGRWPPAQGATGSSHLVPSRLGKPAGALRWP